MAQLVRALAFLLIFASASAVGAEETEVPAIGFHQPVVEVEAPSALGSPFEWFIIGCCVCVSFCAGGYTLITYLRRRDALSTLAMLESRSRSRSRHFADSSGFERGTDE